MIRMEHAFDEAEFFRALSRVRVLLIGSRALVALGVPVITSDYDLWVHVDDIDALNAALAPFDLLPSHTPHEARARGRYVLENDEHVDVLVARVQGSGEDLLSFDDAWARRRVERHAGGTAISMPCVDHLIRTKRWSSRRKDLIDIQALEALRRHGGRS